jgi:hypothetical protein
MVADLKMMRSSAYNDDMYEELDNSNACAPNYTVEYLVNLIIIMKNLGLETGNEVVYQSFINQVATSVRDLEIENARLSEKLCAKPDDIFEPTIKIIVGMNEIAKFYLIDLTLVPLW